MQPRPAGLPLATGALLFLGSATLFGIIAADVVAGRAITRIDAEVVQWLHRRAEPGLTAWVLIFTHLHSTAAISVYGLLIGLYLAVKQRWWALLPLAVGLGGGLALNVLLKLLFQRDRPVFDEPLLTLSTYSFPSGHVAGSTLFYGLAVAYVFTRTRELRWRLLALVGAFIAVCAVAFTRMYLGVHYLSDVTAALAEGIAWLTLTFLATSAWRHRREGARGRGSATGAGP